MLHCNIRIFEREKLKKNEILICAYNLEEMVEIAKLLKFETKFIDINANSGVIDFDLIKNNISEKTSAILFTNMFNRYEDLIELKNFCKNQDILLIEDLAIYFGNFSLVENKNICWFYSRCLDFKLRYNEECVRNLWGCHAYI